MWGQWPPRYLEGGKGDEIFFLHPTFLGGVAKKMTASCPLFWGVRGVAWETLHMLRTPARRTARVQCCFLPKKAALEPPGQTNGQGPVLFLRQKAALEDPGQTNGQGPVLFNGQSTAL